MLSAKLVSFNPSVLSWFVEANWFVVGRPATCAAVIPVRNWPLPFVFRLVAFVAIKAVSNELLIALALFVPAKPIDRAKLVSLRPMLSAKLVSFNPSVLSWLVVVN